MPLCFRKNPMYLSISELECNKENIKAIKTFFANRKVVREFKEADDFSREILLGLFTEEHISKCLFLVVMKNVLDHDYTLLGGVKGSVNLCGHENVQLFCS